MKLEWLIADVTAVGSPTRAESAVFGLFLTFLADFGHFYGRGATLWSGDTTVSPKNLS